MTRRLMSAAILCLTLMAPVVLSANDKGIKVVPRKQVQKERAKRWAVLIGVDKYEDEQGIGSLKYCGQDMKLLYKVLTGPTGGFARVVLCVPVPPVGLDPDGALLAAPILRHGSEQVVYAPYGLRFTRLRITR